MHTDLLVTTLLVSMVHVGSGRSNVLQGAVHRVLLFASVMSLFE